jgi:DNA polymerase III epsilon subunit-like protein
MLNVMLDLETLGNRPSSVIVAIGAVKFGSGLLGDSFYRRIDAESCAAVGMTMDTSAVMFWLKQPEAARLEITKPGEPLATVLQEFALWIEKDAVVWGNGASFDPVVLTHAYRAAGVKVPWRYVNERCYRTVKALFPNVPPDFSGTQHNALDDAKSQALHLMQIMAFHPGALV